MRQRRLYEANDVSDGSETCTAPIRGIDSLLPSSKKSTASAVAFAASLSDGSMAARYFEKVLAALGQVDVEQRDQRQTNEDLQVVRRRTDEHLHEDIARHVVSANARRLQHDRDGRRRYHQKRTATAARKESAFTTKTLRERDDRVCAEAFVQKPLNSFSLVQSR